MGGVENVIVAACGRDRWLLWTFHCLDMGMTLGWLSGACGQSMEIERGVAAVMPFYFGCFVLFMH